MAKDNLKLTTPDVTVDSQATKENEKKKLKEKQAKEKRRTERRAKFVKFFQNLISELKKVSWSKFKSTKDTKGVWEKTGVVLLIIFAFLILFTAFDLGLSELLKLLVSAGTAA